VASVLDPDLPAVGKGEQTRRAVLASAIVRFGRDGYRATSVADIARDAGVGGTAAYAYFPGKEGLFLAALDTDTAAVIEEGIASLADAPDAATWRHRLVDALLDAMEHDHPLARRVLSGLEPHVTGRMLDLPALDDLAASLATYLRDEQADGRIRTDIDPATIARGTVAVIISLTMSMLQFGRDGEAVYGDGVRALFDAALEVPPAP
jgi:AcrR family transcriptional regulator